MKSIVTYYATKTRTFIKSDERAMGIIEEQIVRCTFGAVEENFQWRRRHNGKLYNEPSMVQNREIEILKWALDVTRMHGYGIARNTVCYQDRGK